MNPGELIARMHRLAATPPSTKPFAQAAERAVIKAQSDLARFNTASNTSVTVNASNERVEVRWRTNRNGRGESRLSPARALKIHLDREMKVAREEMRDQVHKGFS